MNNVADLIKQQKELIDNLSKCIGHIFNMLDREFSDPNIDDIGGKEQTYFSYSYLQNMVSELKKETKFIEVNGFTYRVVKECCQCNVCNKLYTINSEHKEEYVCSLCKLLKDINNA